MKNLLLLGFGGFSGTVLRYLVQQLVLRQTLIVFPLGTFIVNITGCFLIGIFYGIAAKYQWMHTEWRLLLITGFCGGYTTFSTFSYEAFSLFKQGNLLYFSSYIILSVMLGILATVAGITIIK